MYHTGNFTNDIPFGKIEEPKKMVELRSSFQRLFHLISNTYYIWDRRIIPTLIGDIQFAKSIRLITDQEINILKKEIHQFLDDFELLASNGKFKDTGNKFELYISDASIDVSYAYLSSEKIYISMLSSFIYYFSSSDSRLSLERIRNWIKSLKRFSTLISGAGEKERILFFEEQRTFVNSL